MLIRKYHVAIVGATGLIGREFVKILGQRDFPSASIHLFASDRSAGKKLFVNHQEIELRELTPYSFDPVDIALFFAGSEVSQHYVPVAVATFHIPMVWQCGLLRIMSAKGQPSMQFK